MAGFWRAEVTHLHSLASSAMGMFPGDFERGNEPMASHDSSFAVEANPSTAYSFTMQLASSTFVGFGFAIFCSSESGGKGDTKKSLLPQMLIHQKVICFRPLLIGSEIFLRGSRPTQIGGLREGDSTGKPRGPSTMSEPELETTIRALLQRCNSSPSVAKAALLELHTICRTSGEATLK